MCRLCECFAELDACSLCTGKTIDKLEASIAERDARIKELEDLLGSEDVKCCASCIDFDTIGEPCRSCSEYNMWSLKGAERD
jgi:hypothetical protein